MCVVQPASPTGPSHQHLSAARYVLGPGVHQAYTSHTLATPLLRPQLTAPGALCCHLPHVECPSHPLSPLATHSVHTCIRGSSQPAPGPLPAPLPPSLRFPGPQPPPPPSLSIRACPSPVSTFMKPWPHPGYRNSSTGHPAPRMASVTALAFWQWQEGVWKGAEEGISEYSQGGGSAGKVQWHETSGRGTDVYQRQPRRAASWPAGWVGGWCCCCLPPISAPRQAGASVLGQDNRGATACSCMCCPTGT